MRVVTPVAKPFQSAAIAPLQPRKKPISSEEDADDALEKLEKRFSEEQMQIVIAALFGTDENPTILTGQFGQPAHIHLLRYFALKALNYDEGILQRAFKAFETALKEQSVKLYDRGVMSLVDKAIELLFAEPQISCVSERDFH